MPLLTDIIRESVGLGKGILGFKEKGRAGFDDFLEVDDFKYTKAIEKAEKRTSRDSSVAKIASIVKGVDVNGSFSCCCKVLQVIRYFALAKEVKDVSQASGSFNWQQFSASLGRWIQLGKVNLTNLLVRKNTGQSFTANDTTDVITANAHGFANGTPVFVQNAGGSLPTGLAADTVYYVRDADTNTFKLAATSGGAAIDLTGAGSGTNTVYRAYLKNVDYEVKTAPGLLFSIAGGAITDGLAIAIKADYPQQKMYQVEGGTKTTIEGELAFYGDPVSGPKQDFFATVRLTPNGDYMMISDDIEKFQMDFEVLKSTDENGNDYYYKLRDRSGISEVVTTV